MFTGQPYSDLRDEEAESRSKEMKKDQEEVERAGRHDNSPRATAKKLPISRSKYSSSYIFILESREQSKADSNLCNTTAIEQDSNL